jgi:hypothetical protein
MSEKKETSPLLSVPLNAGIAWNLFTLKQMGW